MADEKTGAKKVEKITVNIVPSLEPRLGRVYSNYVQVSHSPWDFTIRFGDAPPGGDVQRIRIENEIIIPNIVEVIVVPQLIPAIMKAMETSYNSYLKEFGEKPAKGKKEVGIH